MVKKLRRCEVVNLKWVAFAIVVELHWKGSDNKEASLFIYLGQKVKPQEVLTYLLSLVSLAMT